MPPAVRESLLRALDQRAKRRAKREQVGSETDSGEKVNFFESSAIVERVG